MLIHYRSQGSANTELVDEGPGFPSFKPINPQATKNARKTLQYLYSIKGSKTLSGMHNWVNIPYNGMNTVKIEQGDYPAVHDVELGNFDSRDTIEAYRGYMQDMVNSVVDHYSKGGISVACWHMSYPGTKDWSTGVQRATTNAEFDAIMVPGSTPYKQFFEAVDEVVPYLKQIRDRDIPFVLRPFHEMNGGWFWWGQKTNFVQMWDMLYNHLVNVHQLHNILWMWNWNALNGSWTVDYSHPSAFGGLDRADIFAVDIYNQDYRQLHHDSLLALLGGKLQAIGENGMIPTPAILAAQPHWSWFVTWPDYWSGKEGNTLATRTATFTDPRVLTVGEIGTKPEFAGYADDPINYVRSEDYAAPATGLPVRPKLPGQLALHMGNVFTAAHAYDKSAWIELAQQGKIILPASSGARYRLIVDDSSGTPTLGTQKLTLLKDSFNRADTNVSGVGMATPEIGSLWNTTAFSGFFNIRSNKLATTTGFNGDYAINDIGVADYVYEAYLSGNWSAARATLMVKVVGTTNAMDYFQIMPYSINIGLLRQYNSAKGQVAVTPYPSGKVLKAGEEVKVTVVVKGGTIQVYADDLLALTYEMTAADRTRFLSSTIIGIRHDRPGSYNAAIPTTWDNMVVERLV